MNVQNDEEFNIINKYFKYSSSNRFTMAVSWKNKDQYRLYEIFTEFKSVYETHGIIYIYIRLWRKWDVSSCHI